MRGTIFVSDSTAPLSYARKMSPPGSMLSALMASSRPHELSIRAELGGIWMPAPVWDARQVQSILQSFAHAESSTERRGMFWGVEGNFVSFCTSFNCAACSKIVTSCPCLRSAIAAARPPRPQPTITTWQTTLSMIGSNGKRWPSRKKSWGSRGGGSRARRLCDLPYSAGDARIFSRSWFGSGVMSMSRRTFHG